MPMNLGLGLGLSRRIGGGGPTGLTFSEMWDTFTVGDGNTQIDANGYTLSGSPSTGSIVADAGSTSGKAFHATGTVASVRWFQRDDIATALASPWTTLEVLVKIRTTAAAGARGGIGLIVSTADATGLAIARTAGGTSIGIASDNDFAAGGEQVFVSNIPDDTLYWARFQISGGNIRGRAWADGASEPGSYGADLPIVANLSTAPLGILTRNTTATSIKLLGYTVGVDVSAPAFFSPMFLLSDTRVGQTLTINNPDAAAAYFVEALGPGGTTMLLTYRDITSSGLTLGWRELGLRLRTVKVTLNAGDGGYVAEYSDWTDPIRHATDPVGTVVTTPAELVTAANSAATTVILAAGTTWDGTAMTGLATLDRSASRLTITTPQVNPAVIEGPGFDLSTADGITLQGLRFSHPRTEPVSSTDLLNARYADGLILQGCRFYGPSLTTAELTDNSTISTPKPLASSPYFGAGMNFLPRCVGMEDATNYDLDGVSAENVWQFADISWSGAIKGLRLCRWYWDGIRFTQNIAGASPTVRDLVAQDLVGIYDEVDDVSPHPDLMQFLAGACESPTVEDVIHFPGNTRAGTYSGLKNTTVIQNNGAMNNSVVRGVVTQAEGNAINNGSGNNQQAYYITTGQFETTGPSTGSVRLGSSAFPGTGELYVADSIMGNTIGITAAADGVSNLSNNRIVDAGANALENVFRRAGVRPQTAIDLLVSAMPKLDTDKGAVRDDKPYLRDLPAIPATPAPTVTTIEGGLRFTFTSVPGATEYLVFWRVAGETAWNSSPSASNVIDVEYIGDAVSAEYRCRVKTTVPSRWTATDTRTTGAVTPRAAPAVTLIGLNDYVTDPANSSGGTRNHQITASSLDTGKAHVSIGVIDQLSGSALAWVGTAKGAHITGANAVVSDLTEIGNLYTAPGGSVLAGYAGYGTPDSTVRGARMALTNSGNTSFTSALAMFSMDAAVNFANARFASSSGTTAATRSAVLTRVPSGSRIIAMAYDRTTGVKVAFTAGVTQIAEAQDDLTAEAHFILGTGESTTGGTVTVTASNCWAIVAIAIPAA